MRSTLAVRRLLVLPGALLVGAAGCGPPPEPASPPAAASSAAVAPAAPPAAPAAQGGAAKVDYGSPPRARCIPRADLPRQTSTPAIDARRAQKHEWARKGLEAGALFVELDGRREGVVLPPGYEQAGRLVLVVGYDLPQPIPDLVVDEAGVSGQLLFKMKPFSVRVPWDAVYGLMSEDKALSRWVDDVPGDVLCPEAPAEEDLPLDIDE